MLDALKKLSIIVIALLAPAKAMLISSALLIAVDLVTGILAARKRKEPITSAGLRRTITKVVIYEMAIILGFLTQQYLTGELIPVSNIIASYIGLTELLSVMENMNEISGNSLLKKLLEKLNSTNNK